MTTNTPELPGENPPEHLNDAEHAETMAHIAGARLKYETAHQQTRLLAATNAPQMLSEVQAVDQDVRKRLLQSKNDVVRDVGQYLQGV